MPTLIEPQAPKSYFKHHLSQPLQQTQRRTSRRKYIGTNIRHAIEQVFVGLGGWDAMMAWAKDNPDLFYSSVVPKLLPAEVAEQQAKDGRGIRVLVYAPQAGTTSDKPLEIVMSADPLPVVDEELT